jgi:hypothetical protein
VQFSGSIALTDSGAVLLFLIAHLDSGAATLLPVSSSLNCSYEDALIVVIFANFSAPGSCSVALLVSFLPIVRWAVTLYDILKSGQSAPKTLVCGGSSVNRSGHSFTRMSGFIMDSFSGSGVAAGAGTNSTAGEAMANAKRRETMMEIRMLGDVGRLVGGLETVII